MKSKTINVESSTRHAITKLAGGWCMTEEYLTCSKKYDDAMNMIEGREEIDKAQAFVGDFGGDCTGGQAGGGSARSH